MTRWYAGAQTLSWGKYERRTLAVRTQTLRGLENFSRAQRGLTTRPRSACGDVTNRGAEVAEAPADLCARCVSAKLLL